MSFSWIKKEDSALLCVCVCMCVCICAPTYIPVYEEGGENTGDCWLTGQTTWMYLTICALSTLVGYNKKIFMFPPFPMTMYESISLLLWKKKTNRNWINNIQNQKVHRLPAFLPSCALALSYQMFHVWKKQQHNNILELWTNQKIKDEFRNSATWNKDGL